MAESTLQDRLREHAKSFDGLLSLIPADLYYGKGDTSSQWKKKKQTKEEAAAARRAKLDPDTARNAKDVMDERARKRKLEELEQVDDSELEGIVREQPKQGMKEADKKNKKLKIDTQPSSDSTGKSLQPSLSERTETTTHEKKARAETKAEQRRLKQERRKEKKAKKLKTNTIKVSGTEEPKESQNDEDEGQQTGDDEEDEPDVEIPENLLEDEGALPADELRDIEIDDLVDDGSPRSTASPISTPESPIFDSNTGPSANTSTSSVIPPATAPKNVKLPTDPDLLKSRLAARINALRAARKADGPDGSPAKTRQELMEARRRKEDLRRAHKKEMRMKAKANEEAIREEVLATARDSPMSPAIHNSPDNNFSFGRVAFADGDQLSNDLSALVSPPKRKGPSDPATALEATEKKRQRIAGLDDDKRADIEEKDLWLNAKKRAHGEKVRDDASLLKKTLKRKEKAKKRSEKAWNARKEGIVKSQALRQKKREENLRKRKEEKGAKGKGKKKGGKPGSTKKAKGKKRAGFEGSFPSGENHY